jgi:hypothetical protein
VPSRQQSLSRGPIAALQVAAKLKNCVTNTQQPKQQAEPAEYISKNNKKLNRQRLRNAG